MYPRLETSFLIRYRTGLNVLAKSALGVLMGFNFNPAQKRNAFKTKNCSLVCQKIAAA